MRRLSGKITGIILAAVLAVICLPGSSALAAESDGVPVGTESDVVAVAADEQDVSADVDAEEVQDVAVADEQDVAEPEVVLLSEECTVGAQVVLPEIELPDAEEVFLQYAEEPVLSTSSADNSGTLRRDTLTGNNRKAYGYLQDKILKVSAGQVTSTEVRIPIGELITKSSDYVVTASELKSGKLYETDSSGKKKTDAYGNWILTQEATNALLAKPGIDWSLVLNAVMADFPYECFWFDKTQQVSYGIDGILSYSDRLEIEKPDNAGNGNYVYINLNVAKDYRASASNPYKVSAAKVTAARNAAANASGIIQEAASLTDYEKLQDYCNMICDLTEYDDTAAAQQNAYGDPWQMINVFDGDNSTNAVCEGYAKAFKFLCDQTKFKNSLISCQIVTGTLAESSGAAGQLHMWNLVRMNDGKNYLTDVTNCDALEDETALFLRGYSKVLTAADRYQINAVGKTMIYDYDADTCKLFQTAERTLATADYNVSTAKDAAVSASVSHTHIYISKGNGKAATCTATGKTADRECVICGKVSSGKTIPKVAHEYAQTKATATKEGYLTCINCKKKLIILDADNCTVYQPTNIIYTGRKKKASITVKTRKGKTLTKGTDYTVSYKNNVSAGTASVTIKGKGSYTGEILYKFPIKRLSLKAKSAKTSVRLKYTKVSWDGKAREPAVTVKATVGGTVITLKKGTDYTVTYQNNTKVGTASAVIRGKGNYSGTITKTFRIYPKSTALTKLTANGKQVTVRWEAAKKQVSGYQIQYSPSESFSNNSTDVLVTGIERTSKTIVPEKRKRTYYVRIRTYKTAGGKKYFSAWSKTKSVQVK